MSSGTTFSITGISSSDNDTKKVLIFFDLNYNSPENESGVGETVYHWKTYKPYTDTSDLNTYISNNLDNYEADIDEKEAYWYSSACPHTKEVHNPDGTTTIVDIPKEEVVCPTLITPIDIFDCKIFFGRIIQELSVQRWVTLSKLGIGWTLQQLIEYPNQDGLKDYMDTLLSDNTITQDDYDKIKVCLLEQGVVI